jgi:predicted DNA-binding ribbon-helix-helix protein
VVTAHGEARNFASLLRCCCLIYLDQADLPGGRRFGGAPALAAAE